MAGSARLRSFVARMKVSELQAARERLLDAYAALEAEASALPEAEAVRVLAHGLADLKVGERPAHPEVANLDVAAGSGDPALVARVRARLDRAIAQGRARADLLPVFGGLLGEWLEPDRARPSPSEEQIAALVEPWSRPPTTDASAWIRRLEARIAPDTLDAARARTADLTRAAMDSWPVLDLPPATSELLDEEGRADAAAATEMLPDGTQNPLARELRQALQLAWTRLATWTWPATPLVPTWTRNRYRLRPRTDLVTASLVEGVGRVVEDAVSSVSGTRRLTRLLRLRRLEELNAPPVILQNEQRMLDATVDVFGWLGPDDIGAPGTVERARAGLMAVEASTADYAYASSEIGQLFAGLRADLDLARAHDRPVWVLKTDLAAFYPSVSHALVTELLTWLGLDARLVAVVREVLAAPLPDGTRARRGLPLGLTLSRALESLILTLVVAEVRAAAPVRVLRLVDDLVIVADRAEDLSAAWASLRAVVAEGGLALNEGKTGAVCVGGERPPDAPAGGVRWGLLALGADGAWRVDEPAVDAFAALTSERVLAHASLLDRVACWRDQLRWLQTWLAPTADLGPDHLRAVGDAVARLERLGDGATMATMVRAEVERRFLGGTPGALPDTWLHWPLTAGGLGLPWQAADRVPLELARAERERQSPALPAPVHDPLSDPAWGAWYAHRLTPIAPLEPTSTPEQDDQVKRFVERGTRLGRPGAPLAPYWRWVLHTLGPDVLDAYGSFDFVATDLVPVQLIRGLG